ncbi:PREDICTED: uncharacterized protein LOC108359720 [Rhagoletis zephyria]|uniref:uncharacterized protein LOC108359720 n=1 Tax=Rhagoletis zephyria TaxID=28612 RepID=UPI0008114281|nr:PREDICTED: uncharacterized protein LOC108359720 [Rhagoletis zephyria]XP_036322328.1 uncharacterized protein LOC118736342 [Rhagoletis pomonella]
MIPTAHNVADEATRARRVNTEFESYWLSGSQFLQMDIEHWPQELEVQERDAADDEELQLRYALAVVSYKFMNYNRFSSLSRIVQTLAWVIRFVSPCRNGKQSDETHGLTAWALETAKHALYRQVQTEAFIAQLRLLEKGYTIPRSSAIYQLSPCIDDHCILRVKERIDAAEWLPIFTRQPVILPPNHPLTKLIVSHHHAATKHQNTEATICEIHRHYWIPCLRKLLRSAISNCQVCRVSKATPVAPIMGPLPADRLTP